MWSVLVRAAAALPPQVDAAVCVRPAWTRAQAATGAAAGPCRACAGACPAGAFTLPPGGGAPDLDPAACTGCGACLAACPTGAVSVPGWEAEPWLAAAAEGAALAFACPRAPAGTGAEQVPCLAGLGPELLAALALAGASAVALVTGPCPGCPLGLGGRIAAAVAAARALAAAAGAPALPAAVAAAPGGGGAGVSRRALLLGLRRRAAAAAQTALAPALAPAGAPAAARIRHTRPGRPAARATLRRVLAAQRTPAAGAPALPLRRLQAADTCDVCGACAALCPAPGALAVAPGLGGATLLHQPAACLDCGLCLAACRSRSLHMAPETPAAAWSPGGAPLALAARPDNACPRCGRPAPIAGPCASCRRNQALTAWLAAN